MTTHRVRFSIDDEDEQGGPVPPPPTRNPDVHFQRINGGRSRPQPPIQSPVPHALPPQYFPFTPDLPDSASPSYLPGYRGYPAPGYVMQNAPWVNPGPIQLTQTLSRQQGLGLNILPPWPVHAMEATYQGPPYEVEPFRVPPPLAPIPVPPPISSMGCSCPRNGGARIQRGPWRPLNVPGQGRQLTPIMGSPHSGLDGRQHSPVDRQSESSGDTLYESMDDEEKLDDFDFLKTPIPASPPRAHLPSLRYDDPVQGEFNHRPPLRAHFSDVRLDTGGFPLSRSSRNTSRLEEGGVRARPGMFASLLSLYGVSRNAQPSSRHSNVHTLSRENSMMSERQSSQAHSTALQRGLTTCNPILDEDDPRITGAGPNRRDEDKRPIRPNFMQRLTSRYGKQAKDPKEPAITYHISPTLQRQKFILRLAKALMMFGAPSHRIESQLNATALVLEVAAQFVHLPNIIIASFGEADVNASETHFIKASGGLNLGQLHKVHQVYREVVHDEIGVEKGSALLSQLIKEKPIYSLKLRCAIAFLCCALICPLAFGGSFLDMWVAGACGAVLCFLQLHAAGKSAMYANVFEISVTILISFVARALSSIPSQLFCYEAISSSGIVLILPGYLILCSSLELASKSIVNGSVRMIYAIIYALFLGFGLTIGSDLYLLFDNGARDRLYSATTSLDHLVVLHGSFLSDNSTVPDFEGTFTFSNETMAFQHNTDLGCHRRPDWPWYQQQFPLWTLFILVPAFSLFSSSWSLQPLRSRQLPVMVFISCAAFAANTAANRYIFNRSDIVSAIGAFVIGLLGNIYSRLFRGTAFQVMVVGVCFLVPSGISAAGGLTGNYRGDDHDQYTTGLTLGFKIVQVAIGITVGLFGSGLLVYSFGSKKTGALFAF